jgi:hypothetical protein
MLKIACAIGAQAFVFSSGIFTGYRYYEHLDSAKESFELSFMPTTYDKKIAFLEEFIAYANK